MTLGAGPEKMEGEVYYFMFKLYSKGCQYALRALAYVVTERGSERFQIAEICEKVGIPEPFTRKVFQDLVQAGFLHAHRGPGGGYSLAESPDRISLLDVIHAVDGEDTFNHCVLGFEECGSAHPCPMHYRWAEAKSQLLDQLAQDTLQDIADFAAKRLKNPPLS